MISKGQKICYTNSIFHPLKYKVYWYILLSRKWKFQKIIAHWNSLYLLLTAIFIRSITALSWTLLYLCSGQTMWISSKYACIPSVLSLPCTPLSHPHPAHLGEHWALGSARCAIYGCFPLAVYFTRVVYICIFQCYSLQLSHSPLLPLCAHVRSSQLRLCSCPANSHHVSRAYICVNLHIWFSLFWVHSVWQTSWVHPHHCKWPNFVPFCYLSNIPLCMSVCGVGI